MGAYSASQGTRTAAPPASVAFVPLLCKETLPKHYQDRKKDIRRTEGVTHLPSQLTQHHSLDEGDKELSAWQIMWFLPTWNSYIAWVFVSPSHWERAMRPAP